MGKKAVDGNKWFTWQQGYGVFSVSYSHLGKVERYIANQDVHHATRSYQDEFRLLCEQHGIEIDERYVWDYWSRPLALE